MDSGKEDEAEPRMGTPSDSGTRTHRALGVASRARLLEALRSSPEGLTLDRAAASAGLHPNTVRFHLQRLVEAGLAAREPEPRSGPGRPRTRYLAAPETLAADAAGYRLLARVLAGGIAAAAGDPAAAGEAAGRAWGVEMVGGRTGPEPATADEAVARVVELLASMGFDPEAVRDGDRVRVLLHRCPFGDLARERQDVVCSSHLGIMRGALRAMGAPVRATRLRAFVAPGLCVADLARARR